MFSVQFVTYSGMPIPLLTSEDKREVLDYCRSRVKAARRRGQPVSNVGRGKWEFETPETAFAISDRDGFLVVRKVRPCRCDYLRCRCGGVR